MNKALATGLLLTGLAIAGCQSTNTKPDTPSTVRPSSATAEQLFADALLQSGTAGQSQQLAAAEMFMTLGEAERALAICENLNPQNLGDALYAKQREIQSRALIKLGNIYAAKGQLEAPRLDTLLASYSASHNNSSSALNDTQVVALHELRADLYYDLNEPTLAIRERIILGHILAALPSRRVRSSLTSNGPSRNTDSSSDPKVGVDHNAMLNNAAIANDQSTMQINQELIWMMLMEQDIQQLQATSNDLQTQALSSSHTTTQSAQGWYELAIVNKDNQRNINQQYDALTAWQQQWPNHPANEPLPADLALIQHLVNNQPQRIALMLPLSGKLKPVAEAIRDGFMAAYFANEQAGGQTPEINIYDVSHGDINEHYDFAVSQGAQVVVGPLSKENISELAMRPALEVPTLALNQIEASQSYPTELFQLGLGIEDEAAQAAEKAFRDGKRHALIIAPAGSQGDRATQVFTQQWQALGATVSDGIRYSNELELSKIIEDAMHLNGSKARARDLRSIVGSFEFEPRRRQDLDMIFLVAQPREGRQIKPLLAFHYAGDLPIYSTSSIYEGEPNRNESDLNGIMFSHLPWFFQDTPEKTTILNTATLNARSQRLYALGVDAYYLFPRLGQLGSASHANFWGQTGVLSLNRYRQFLRKQQWAQFKRGKAQALISTQQRTQP
ncbi:penicillin-binding protein activator [Marinagarivorans algicola]|uniref:penicillin-binding protein activator n=1 Tax=Marinagarivorans algicola TaxID=1513270 RepID=UPI0006B9D560|nr:penicillin-binding protein activator [Marinagarivorans algicola]